MDNLQHAHSEAIETLAKLNRVSDIESKLHSKLAAELEEIHRIAACHQINYDTDIKALQARIEQLTMYEDFYFKLRALMGDTDFDKYKSL